MAPLAPPPNQTDPPATEPEPVVIEEPFLKEIEPLVAALSLLAQRMTSPPAVVIDLEAARAISPEDFSKISPDPVPAVVLMLPSTVIFPP